MIQSFLKLINSNPYNKFLLGLAVFVIVGIALCSQIPKERPPVAQSVPTEANNNRVEPSRMQPTQNTQIADETGKLTPQCAVEFIKWWSGNAMDYRTASAQRGHQEAWHWMTPEAARTFEAYLWSPTLSTGVLNGTIIAAFQPIDVQAEAVNPDGSVVVNLSGTLVLQSNARPETKQVSIDLLVRQEKEGLRIAGIYSR